MHDPVEYQRQYRAKHGERLNAAQRRRRAKSGGTALAVERKRRARNSDKLRAQAAVWREKNRARVLAYAAEYRLKNKDMLQRKQRERRAALKAIKAGDAQAIEVFRRKAIKVASQSGSPHLAEDFAGYALLKKVERRLNGNQEPVLRTLFIDFLRETYGDVRTGAGAARSLAMHATVSTFDDEAGEQEHHDVDDSTGQTDAFNAIIEGVELNERERAIVILHFKYGLKQREVAYAFGLSEANISLQMNAILKRLKKGKE